MSRRSSVKETDGNGAGKKEETASAEAKSPSARHNVQSPPETAAPPDSTATKPEAEAKPDQPPQDAPLAAGASSENKSSGSISLPRIGSSSLNPVDSGSLPRTPTDSKPPTTLTMESSHTQDSSIGRYGDITASLSLGKKLEGISRPSTPSSDSGKSLPRRPSQPTSPKTLSSPPHAFAQQESPGRITTPGVPGTRPSNWSRGAEGPTESQDEGRRAPPPTLQENTSSDERSRAAVSPSKRARSLTEQRGGAQQDRSEDYYTSSPRQVISRNGTPGAIRSVSTAASPRAALVSPGSIDGRGAVRRIADTELHSPTVGTEESEEAGFVLHFPLATLVVIWIQLRVHWDYLHEHYPGRCASPSVILREGHWEQMVYAAFHHVDLWHLVIHQFCFFLRGLVLESALGKLGFTVVVVLVVALVGLFNTGIAQFAYLLTKAPTFNNMCVYSSAGVIVALDLINRRHFNQSIVPFRRHLWGWWWPLIYGALEVFALLVSSKNAPFAMLSGLLVGALMARLPVKRMAIRVRHPKLRLHVAAVHWGPITSLFAAAIVTSYVFGPYPEGSAAAKSQLTFKHPVRPRWVLPALYVGTVYQLAYVLLTLLTVGSELERERGRRWFVQTALGLLVSVNVVQDILSWIVWNHVRAFQDGLPAPFLHSSTCSCGLFGTLLALKVVHNEMHPESVFTMASFCIPVPFWSGLLLEVLTLNLVSSSGSSLGHVIGILIGIVAANFTWPCLVSCVGEIWS